MVERPQPRPGPDGFSSGRSRAVVGPHLRALRRARSRAALRAIVSGATATLAVVGVVGVSAAGGRQRASGHAKGVGATVSLLPATAAIGKTWAWTAKCGLLPSVPGSCGTSAPNVGAFQLDGDEWNLGTGKTATGSVDMSLSSTGALEVQGDLPSAPPCTATTCLAPSANTWVRGYPDVLYGINQCHASTSPATAPGLKLPVKVDVIPSPLVGTTTYSSTAQQVTYDIAYDMWLSPTSTRAPCLTDGTVEIMVWTDYDAPALLPASMRVTTASVPFSLDGSYRAGTANWSVYASNIYRAGRTAPWGGTLWFVPDQADITGRGTVSVDLSAVFAAAGSLLERNYGWGNFAREYWLDTVPFGMEFGPQSAAVNGAGPAYFSLNISSYCLAVSAKLFNPAC